jgi:hypothetical protein
MGTVTSIEDWRSERAPVDDPSDRLERAVQALDAALRETSSHLLADPQIERDLLAITGAVSIGLLEEAADRAERLRELLLRRARRGG